MAEENDEVHQMPDEELAQFDKVNKEDSQENQHAVVEQRPDPLIQSKLKF